jgi:hypothetical protein
MQLVTSLFNTKMHQFKKKHKKCIDEYCHYWMSLPPLAHVINFHVFSALDKGGTIVL